MEHRSVEWTSSDVLAPDTVSRHSGIVMVSRTAVMSQTSTDAPLVCWRRDVMVRQTDR